MIIFSAPLRVQIIEHSLASLPNEACGLLGGVLEVDEKTRDNDRLRKTVREIYCLENADKSPIHFSIDSLALRSALADIRARGHVLLGDFHSHPSTAARPSDEDVRLAALSKYGGAVQTQDLSHVIVSLMNGSVIIKSFTIESGRYTQEECRTSSVM